MDKQSVYYVRTQASGVFWVVARSWDEVHLRVLAHDPKADIISTRRYSHKGDIVL